jgi:hypothetical protein
MSPVPSRQWPAAGSWSFVSSLGTGACHRPLADLGTARWGSARFSSFGRNGIDNEIRRSRDTLRLLDMRVALSLKEAPGSLAEWHALIRTVHLAEVPAAPVKPESPAAAPGPPTLEAHAA